jgi:FixJ family two-component response regulator
VRGGAPPRGFLERPACLVIDVHLGNMNGFQLQLQLTAEGLAIPTIFVTAHDDAVTERIAERAGCVAYVTKPIDGDVLLDAIPACRRACRPRHRRDYATTGTLVNCRARLAAWSDGGCKGTIHTPPSRHWPSPSSRPLTM